MGGYEWTPQERAAWNEEGGEDRYLDSYMEDRLSGLTGWTDFDPYEYGPDEDEDEEGEE